jgi:hypothetical protein
MPADLAANDPCRSVEPGWGKVKECEAFMAKSHNALVNDYNQCVALDPATPERCSGILSELTSPVSEGPIDPTPSR